MRGCERTVKRLDPEFRYGTATFHPKGMTADELTAGCLQARLKFNTLRSMCHRAFAPATNMRTPYRLGMYLLSNLISKREILRKQGHRLGSPAALEPLRAFA